MTAFISVFAAVMLTMIAIGIQHPGKHVDAVTQTSFYRAFIAVTNITFAYGMPSDLATHLDLKRLIFFSRTRCFLWVHLRDEEPPRLSQGFIYAPNHQYPPIYGFRGGDLSIWGTGRGFASFGIYRSCYTEDCVWHCNAHRK